MQDDSALSGAPLSDSESSELINRHEQLVTCTACYEWTTYGESCCGMTQCDSECPICEELGY